MRLGRGRERRVFGTLPLILLRVELEIEVKIEVFAVYFLQNAVASAADFVRYVDRV